MAVILVNLPINEKSLKIHHKSTKKCEQNLMKLVA